MIRRADTKNIEGDNNENFKGVIFYISVYANI
jgi:hypothetical protein